jgi:hypothetical protein
LFDPQQLGENDVLFRNDRNMQTLHELPRHASVQLTRDARHCVEVHFDQGLAVDRLEHLSPADGLDDPFLA